MCWSLSPLWLFSLCSLVYSRCVLVHCCGIYWIFNFNLLFKESAERRRGKYRGISNEVGQQRQRATALRKSWPSVTNFMQFDENFIEKVSFVFPCKWELLILLCSLPFLITNRYVDSFEGCQILKNIKWELRSIEIFENDCIYRWFLIQTNEIKIEERKTFLWIFSMMKLGLAIS